MSVKLTKPQVDLLREIEEQDGPVSTSYAPAKALVKGGLAVWKDAMFCDVLSITDEGRQFIKDHPHV